MYLKLWHRRCRLVLVLSIVLQRGLGVLAARDRHGARPVGIGVTLGIGLIGAALMAAGCLGVGIAALHAATLWLLLTLVLAGMGWARW